MTRHDANSIVFHLGRLIDERIDMAIELAKPNIDGPDPDVRRGYRRRIEDIETDLIDAIVREA